MLTWFERECANIHSHSRESVSVLWHCCQPWELLANQKTKGNSGIKRSFFKGIKSIYEKCTASLIVNGFRPKGFSLRSEQSKNVHSNHFYLTEHYFKMLAKVRYFKSLCILICISLFFRITFIMFISCLCLFFREFSICSLSLCWCPMFWFFFPMVF